MSRFRINEIFLAHKASGNKVDRKELSKKLFPDAPEISALCNIGNILNGKTVRFRAEWIEPLCNEFGCTPNELFDMEGKEVAK